MIKRHDGHMKIMLEDELTPEDEAMLQALYSRSAESAETHIDRIRAGKSGKFMESYYVGYNHKSIGDCGTTTLFIEGVSILAAKAIQDSPLYSGQETSTRYIDMARRHIVDPIGTPASRAILDRWMGFYVEKQPAVAAHLRAKYPRRPEEPEKAYENAIKARTFDVMRGFLPSGITTQLSWHVNLRQAGDRLAILKRHPLAEVRTIARTLEDLLIERYPSSSGSIGQAAVSGQVADDSSRAARDNWEQLAAIRTYARDLDCLTEPRDMRMARLSSTVDDVALLRDDRLLVLDRPRGAVLPHYISTYGQIVYRTTIDYGAWRDIQRHRNGVCRVPMVNLEYGMGPWYFEEMGAELGKEAAALVRTQREDIVRQALSGISPMVQQYYVPLGFLVPLHVTYCLPAFLYVVELRSSKTVHPTLRGVVHDMVRLFKERHPDIPVHADMSPDDWTVRRGAQTIEART